MHNMQKKKKLVRSVWLLKLLRLHVVITALSLGAYFSVVFFDPGFLSYDLRQKYHAFADETITLVATVLGPPAKPVVTGIGRCSTATRGLRNSLNWPDDSNTYTYDIGRDGSPLVTGLTVSAYNDTGVVLNAAYEYTVTANGPMGPGFAISDPVSVATPSECGATVSNSVANIAPSSGQAAVLQNNTLVSITDLQPVFSGISTIPYAIVHIQVESLVVFIAIVIADANGYWSWSPPTQLSVETHTLTVEAVDPDDPSITEVSSFTFAVVGSESSTHNSDSKKSHTQKTSVALTAAPTVAALLPFDFSLSVENSDQAVMQGQDVQTVLKISDIPKQYNGITASVRYNLIDEKGRTIFSTTRDTSLKKGQEIRENFPMPLYMAPGGYSFQVQIVFGKVNVSRATRFLVTEIPLLRFGGGTVITYEEIVRNLGWVTLFLLVLLLLWSFLFVREYWMYLHAVRHITERHLEKAGLMTKRKEVVR